MLLEEPIHSHYCNLNLNLSFESTFESFLVFDGGTKERKLKIKKRLKQKNVLKMSSSDA